MPELLELTIESDGSTTTIGVAGELDLTSVEELQAAVQREFDAARSVRLSFSKLRFLDSTGLSALVDLNAAAESAAVDLVLTDVPDHAARLLAITKLDEVLTIES